MDPKEMTRSLYHDAVEIVTKDGDSVCTLHAPYFDKEDLVDIIRRTLQISENFIILGYQTGQRERKIKEATAFYKKMTRKKK